MNIDAVSTLLTALANEVCGKCLHVSSRITHPTVVSATDGISKASRDRGIVFGFPFVVTLELSGVGGFLLSVGSRTSDTVRLQNKLDNWRLYVVDDSADVVPSESMLRQCC